MKEKVGTAMSSQGSFRSKSGSGTAKKEKKKTVHATATKNEIRAWLLFDAANSANYQVLTGVFLSLFFVFMGEQVACPYGYNINTVEVPNLWNTPNYTSRQECSTYLCSNITSPNLTLPNYKKSPMMYNISLSNLSNGINPQDFQFEILSSSNPLVIDNEEGVSYIKNASNSSHIVLAFSAAHDWVTGSAFVTWKLYGSHGTYSERTTYVNVVKSSTTCTEKIEYLGFPQAIESYVTFTIGFSVVCQIVVFLSVSSFADFGSYRKTILMWSYTICCFLIIAHPFLALDPIRFYKLSGVFLVLENVTFGVAIIMYNSQLPFLAKCHPSVRKMIAEKAKASDIVREYDNRVEELGTNGYVYGYVGGVWMLLVSVALVVVFGSTFNTYVYIFVSVGLWMLIMALPMYFYYRPRPGVALPKRLQEGNQFLNIAFFSWIRFYHVLENLSILPEHLKFTIAYFIYTDSYSTCTKMGVLFALRDIGMTFGEVSYLGVIVPVFAIIGIVFCSWYRKKYKVSALTMVRRELIVLCVFPVLGLIGFIDALPFGAKSKIEMYILAAILGLVLGPIENHSRIAFIDFIPPGQTAEYFALFEITDKGSSWMGPFLTALLWNLFGQMRIGFIYIGFMIFVSLIILVTINERKAIQDSQSLKIAIAIKNLKKKRDNYSKSPRNLRRFLSLGSRSSSRSGSSSSFSQSRSKSSASVNDDSDTKSTNVSGFRASSYVASAIASRAASSNCSYAESAASMIEDIEDELEEDLDEIDGAKMEANLDEGEDENTTKEEIEGLEATMKARMNAKNSSNQV